MGITVKYLKTEGFDQIYNLKKGPFFFFVKMAKKLPKVFSVTSNANCICASQVTSSGLAESAECLDGTLFKAKPINIYRALVIGQALS